MINPFLNKSDKPTCVILCGGLGTRMYPLTQEFQKVMVNYKNKPILHYIIDYWTQYSDEFVFIVGYKKEQVIDYIPKCNILKHVIVDGNPEKNSLAEAIALTEPYVKDHFIVALGDCIISGKLNFPKEMDQGIGVIKNKEEIYRNYEVFLKNGSIKRVIEKPKEINGDLCGMGCYFLKRKMYNYIGETKPSERTGKIEFTDVLQTMINNNLELKPVYLDGMYQNMTTVKDVEV